MTRTGPKRPLAYRNRCCSTMRRGTRWGFRCPASRKCGSLEIRFRGQNLIGTSGLRCVLSQTRQGQQEAAPTVKSAMPGSRTAPSSSGSPGPAQIRFPSAPTRPVGALRSSRCHGQVTVPQQGRGWSGLMYGWHSRKRLLRRRELFAMRWHFTKTPCRVRDADTPAALSWAPGGRGSKRAVGDMPKKCPCEGQRRWFFRDILPRHGHTEIAKRAPSRPALRGAIEKAARAACRETARRFGVYGSSGPSESAASKYTRRDSNPQPSVPKTDALSN